MRFIALLLTLAIAGCGHATAANFPPRAKTTKAAIELPRHPREEPEPPPVPPTPPVALEPVLELPERVEGDVGTFIVVKGKTNGTHIQWVPLDKGLAVFPPGMLKDSLATVVQSATPGQYRLLAYTALGSIPSDPQTVMVVVHGPQPPPVPPVPPVPPTPPVPPVPPPPPPPDVTTASQLWIVVVSDFKRHTPEVTEILLGNTSRQLRAEWTAAGHSWRTLDVLEPEAAKFAAQTAANGGVPCVVIMAKDGKWLNKDPDDMKLPLTADGFRALIQRYTTPVRATLPASRRHVAKMEKQNAA